MTRQFSPFAAFSHAVKSLWHNRAYAMHLSWPWMLILLPFDFMKWKYADPVFASWKPDVVMTPEMAAALATYGLPAIVVSIIALSSLAVNWHRYVLLDDKVDGLKRLRMDASVRRYVSNLFLLAFIMFLVVILPVVATQMVSLINPALGQVVFAIALLLSMAYSFRLSLRFPALAIGRSDYHFMQGVKDTRGQFLQIGTFVALLLMFTFALQVLVGLIGSAFGSEAVFVLGFLASWITSLLGITVLTSLYGFFVEGRSY